jgi:hypothetical protein
MDYTKPRDFFDTRRSGKSGTATAAREEQYTFEDLKKYDGIIIACSF